METEPAADIPVCYRHPDRQTRLACTNCDRPVCVDCVTPAPVGQRCPQCAKPAHNVTIGARQETSPVTMVVLAAAVGLFLIGMLVPGARLELFQRFAQANIAVIAGEWWRVITAGFLHAGLTHVLFNMWALWVFGPPLEREVGSGPFAGLYLAGLLWGSAAYYWFGPPFGLAVGASGAIFGLFGAWFAVSVRNRHTAVGQAQMRQMLVLLGINAALPLMVPQIAWQAHLGGFAAGAVVALMWSAVQRRPRTVAIRTLAGFAVAAAGMLAILLR